MNLISPGAKTGLFGSRSDRVKAGSDDYPEVSTLNELMDEYKTPESSRRLAKLVLASGELRRPVVIGPPGVPTERVKILRQAFIRGAE